jgi:hypothetical protein
VLVTFGVGWALFALVRALRSRGQDSDPSRAP